MGKEKVKGGNSKAQVLVKSRPATFYYKSTNEVIPRYIFPLIVSTPRGGSEISVAVHRTVSRVDNTTWRQRVCCPIIRRPHFCQFGWCVSSFFLDFALLPLPLSHTQSPRPVLHIPFLLSFFSSSTSPFTVALTLVNSSTPSSHTFIFSEETATGQQERTSTSTPLSILYTFPFHATPPFLLFCAATPY